jgi:hypothetical protein
MSRRDEIFEILVDYARTHGGNSPTQRELWREVMRVTSRKMAYGVLLRHIEKLESDGRLKKVDGQIVIQGADWNPPDEPQTEPQDQ